MKLRIFQTALCGVFPIALVAQLFLIRPLSAAGPYTDNGDGTVTDTATNLRWQKCSMSQTNDAGCTGTATTAIWSAALTYCSGLTLASKTWRLPNVNELKSLVDSSSTINVTAFPNTPSGGHWTSSTYILNTWAWWVDGAYVGGNGSKNGGLYVRCVATGP